MSYQLKWDFVKGKATKPHIWLTCLSISKSLRNSSTWIRSALWRILLPLNFSSLLLVYRAGCGFEENHANGTRRPRLEHHDNAFVQWSFHVQNQRDRKIGEVVFYDRFSSKFLLTTIHFWYVQSIIDHFVLINYLILSSACRHSECTPQFSGVDSDKLDSDFPHLSKIECVPSLLLPPSLAHELTNPLLLNTPFCFNSDRGWRFPERFQ